MWRQRSGHLQRVCGRCVWKPLQQKKGSGPEPARGSCPQAMRHCVIIGVTRELLCRGLLCGLPSPCRACPALKGPMSCVP
eukprot:244685-Chlamydomonas_euryale.AAC.5